MNFNKIALGLFLTFVGISIVFLIVFVFAWLYEIVTRNDIQLPWY